jgi:hypothetical protein
MNKESENIIQWLLHGDVAIQYQVKRDLLNCSNEELVILQKRISEEGWGKAFLEKRNNETKMWGNGAYSPKWVSTHYSLLDLKNIGISPAHPFYIESSELLLNKLWYNKGQVQKYRFQDMCICGMLLNICCYAHVQSSKFEEIVDYILDKHFADGGWNCSWPKGHTHSSLHTTLSVLEGIQEYYKNGYSYRLNELLKAKAEAHEFILQHHLFKSHSTLKVIDDRMTKLSFPCRWKYDILRCLDYFQNVNCPYDERMDDALTVLLNKKRKSNRWPIQQKHTGLVHFDMEAAGSESRWNTLRTLRVLKEYKTEIYASLLVE